MGELVKRVEIPASTPQISKSMSSDQLQDHRARIAFEVKTVLSAYFQPHEAEEIKAAQLAWWCDELQDWTQEQVLWALRKWNRDSPDKRPTPGHILAICKEARGRKFAASLPKPPPEKPREKLSAQDRQAISARVLAQANFTPQTFGKETPDA